MCDVCVCVCVCARVCVPMCLCGFVVCVLMQSVLSYAVVNGVPLCKLPLMAASGTLMVPVLVLIWSVVAVIVVVCSVGLVIFSFKQLVQILYLQLCYVQSCNLHCVVVENIHKRKVERL